IAESSDAHDVSATTTAEDVLGHLRTINVDRLDLPLFNVDVLTDLTRNIATFQFVGLGIPLSFIPGILPVLGAIPVLGGVWGWNPSAVSGHANMAVVYDYYKNVLGVTSFDGEGAPINVVVEYNPFGPLLGWLSPFENAFWDPSNEMLVF